MIIQKIHENWKMRRCGDDNDMRAIVPGSVYNDLIKNEKMQDPYYRDNELHALKIMEEDYEYTTKFLCDSEMFAKEEVILRFEGLDTIANIYLNGLELGYADNMNRVWEYKVKEFLKEGENNLKIIFHSPLKYISKAEEKESWPGVTETMKGAPHIRKSQCMFGWDWGARLPDAGIFREVKLLGINHARVDSVYIWQYHEQENVTLKIDIDVNGINYPNVQRFGENNDYLFQKGLSYKITVFGPEGERIFSGEDCNEIKISAPLLWWPNGMGDHPLYRVYIELLKDGEICDTWEKRIGLRTLTVRREKDEYGESFAHEINGIPIFAMGANYIPEDSVLSRVNPERTRDLMQQAVDAHFNCIRVWGGGYYPDDYFWDICDELGLIVWMDFAFACAVYLLPEEFEKNITTEFVENVKRIRNHACLGLWCGNNEIEGFMQGGLFEVQNEYKADYIKLFEYIIPKVVREYDPQTFYWPSSPSSGGAFKDSQSEHMGDVHYWDVWHGNKPFAEYRKFFFRYVSEFGFQSFPSIKTIETFTEPEDRNIFSYVMEKHQRNVAANGKIMNYMEQTYLYPNGFDTLIYASQLLQAEAIRYGVEHFRRNRGRCMGTIIWQLNDCWPVASWSSIDYYGRWKALHYYAKRFFTPLLLSCQEESVLTQDMNPNPEPFELKKSIKLCVSNETGKEENVTVSWALRNANAKVLRSGSKEIKAVPFSSQWMEEVQMPEADEFKEYVSYEMLKDQKVISSGTVLYTVPKYFQFLDPKLKVRAEGDEIVVTAQAYARSIEIRNAEDDLILTDNFFDMNAGERRVRVKKGETDGLEVRSVYNIK